MMKYERNHNVMRTLWKLCMAPFVISKQTVAHSRFSGLEGPKLITYPILQKDFVSFTSGRPLSQ